MPLCHIAGSSSSSLSVVLMYRTCETTNLPARNLIKSWQIYKNSFTADSSVHLNKLRVKHYTDLKCIATLFCDLSCVHNIFVVLLCSATVLWWIKMFSHKICFTVSPYSSPILHYWGQYFKTLAATLRWFTAGGAIRIALRQLLQNRKWRHLWRHNSGSRWKL